MKEKAGIVIAVFGLLCLILPIGIITIINQPKLLAYQQVACKNLNGATVYFSESKGVISNISFEIPQTNNTYIATVLLPEGKTFYANVQIIDGHPILLSQNFTVGSPIILSGFFWYGIHSDGHGEGGGRLDLTQEVGEKP
jgi:hypothetical protein